MLRPTSGPPGNTRASTLYSRAFCNCSTGPCRFGNRRRPQGRRTGSRSPSTAAPTQARSNRPRPASGSALISRLLTIRFVLVPTSVHMPARITMWFIGSSSFEIDEAAARAHSWATGTNRATTGVLLITLDSAPVTNISFALRHRRASSAAPAPSARSTPLRRFRAGPQRRCTAPRSS